MNQRGFTLIEITIATLVVSLLAILVVGFLTDTFVNHMHKSARSDMLHESQIALDLMNKDIRHSANVDDQNRWPDDNAPDSADPYSWRSNGNTLILAHPVVNSDNDFIYRDSFAYLTYKNNLIYFVDNGTLYRRTLAADVNGNKANTTCPEGTSGCSNDSKLAENVKLFQVKYFNAENEEVAPSEARAVQATLRLEKQVYNRTLDVEYEIKSVFRNE